MSLDSEEMKKIEGHSYDGIDELDNALPKWWINGFYLTIFFAVGYILHYGFGEGISQLEEYGRAKNSYELTQLTLKKDVKMPGEEELRAYLKQPTIILAGKGIFQTKCISCHGALGQGGIGPNLCDDYWIHGSKMTQIMNTVANGVLDKGMPPWGTILKQEELNSVVAYVKSLRGTNPKGAKPPQGTLVQE